MGVPTGLRFSGRHFTAGDLKLIGQVTSDFPALSLTELSRTLCELLDWKRCNGKLKTDECRALLEHLRALQQVTLPVVRQTAPTGPRPIQATAAGAPREPLTGTVSDYEPLSLLQAHGAGNPLLKLFAELIDRYHYLGYRVPFGAQLRYLVGSQRLPGRYLACLLFSSPAWTMARRDAWIGWSDSQRRQRLQYLVANSRFLILPWVSVPGLASKILSLAARRLPEDWQSLYGYRPVLLETLVDTARFRGTCYRAANWIHLGQTQGRGRMDRHHRSHARAVKDLYVFPLRRQVRRFLCDSRVQSP